jgi:hypothetical protein
MSRLLFAAARGARIQYKGGYPSWREAEGEYKSLRSLPEMFRIHPDDVNLSYGPISNALRESALRADRNNSLVLQQKLGSYWMSHVDFRTYTDCDDRRTRQTFLLILAESLADEGL